MAHKHGVYDGDIRFKIDPVTRKIVNKSGKNTLMLGDHNSERMSFEISRTVDGHSMEQCTVEVHYTNTDAQTGQESKDVYTVKDLQLSPDSADVVICSWLLTKTATMYAGPLVFSLHYKCLTGAEIDYQWSTEDNTDFTIRANTYNTESVTTENTDTLAQWKEDISGVGEAVKQGIVEQGEAVKASIPADYTALSATANDNMRSKAPAIVLTAQGETIAVADASDCYLRGLRILGKSTQDGTPTPDAPVEIVSVESPTVTMYGKNLLNIGTVEIDAYKLFDINLPAGTYTLSAVVTSDDTDAAESLVVFKPSDDSNIYVRMTRGQRNAVTFTSNLPIVRMDVYAGNNYDTSLGDTAIWSDLQLEIGESGTGYEPYGEVQSISVPNQLPGIPVTSGGNYTDANGQQWICDEIDLARGVYVQRVGYIENILTNSTGKNEYTTDATDGFKKYTVRRNLLNMVANADHTAMGLCNRYSVLPISGNITNNTANFNTCIAWSRTSGGFYIMVPDTKYADLDAFVADLTANPVEVYYVLAYPVETALSDAEIAAFKALHSNYPNTTVFNDAGATMEVAYVADTKTYIDNKLLELVQN